MAQSAKQKADKLRKKRKQQLNQAVKKTTGLLSRTTRVVNRRQKILDSL